jgi:hypothetical protein
MQCFGTSNAKGPFRLAVRGPHGAHNGYIKALKDLIKALENYNIALVRDFQSLLKPLSAFKGSLMLLRPLSVNL